MDALREAAMKRGVSADRLVFARRVPNDEYFARLPLGDLFLDTHPYGAHSTAMDALWMGLPVLTRPGDSFASRVAASLVTAAGLPELVADSDEQYIATAIALANDPARTRSIRTRLQDARSRSGLFDIDRFTRDLEALYERMHARSVSGLAPDHLPAGQA